MKQGSVLLTIKIPREKVIELWILTKSGRLKRWGAVDVILRGVDLGGFDLHGVDLSEADLTGANLSGANLQSAILNDANLTEANMVNADLAQATLNGAKLQSAILDGANLQGSDLTNANLSHADLSNTVLAGAIYDKLTVWPSNFSIPDSVRLIDVIPRSIIPQKQAPRPSTEDYYPDSSRVIGQTSENKTRDRSDNRDPDTGRAGSRSMIYVGGLSYDTKEEELAALFSQAGTVVAVHIATDRDTGRSRGFAFVEMSTESETVRAVQMFNGKQMNGRRLTVGTGSSREDRRSGYGGGRLS